ncbi:MAG: hypothetical protein WC490_04900 [Candidatus Margulisiibacteriota bacterium]
MGLGAVEAGKTAGQAQGPAKSGTGLRPGGPGKTVVKGGPGQPGEAALTESNSASLAARRAAADKQRSLADKCDEFASSASTPEGAALCRSAADSFRSSASAVESGDAESASRYHESGTQALAGTISRCKDKGLEAKKGEINAVLKTAEVYREANKWNGIFGVIKAGIQIAAFI